ncbi:hypothetical protein B0H14DRAFT_2609129 [Mycena olivaceomarginata]|nr:hypothetical protein B0H14DRAFT_2609129 [Mycena olivaceomarginata]
MPNPNGFSLSHQIHGKSASPSRRVANGRKTPESGIVCRVLAIWNHFRLGHVAGREVIATPNRNGLWKDGEITRALRIDQLQREGKSPPYQECRENGSPHNSWWWPSAIRQLYRETEAEQRGIDLAFQKLHPLHSRQPLDSQFLLDQSRLHQRLACSEGVFYMRTLVQEGVTAGAASQAGSLAAFSAADTAFRAAEARAAAARTQEAIECLLKTEYLAGWLAHTEDSIHSWGTVDDPRNSSPPPGWGTGGWGTGGWGTAATGGWGTVGTGGTGGWGAGTGWGTAAQWPPNPVPVRRRRMFKLYGYRRMGAIFRHPRVVGWRQRRDERRFGWLRRLERQYLSTLRLATTRD